MLKIHQNKSLLINTVILLILFTFSFFNSNKCNAAVYLDGMTTGCNDGSTNYSPPTRSCGSGSDTVYNNLGSFGTHIIPNAINYIRSGNYFRDNAQGSLVIASSKSGTAGSHTIIKAYPGEERQAVIGTATRGATYNSNPGDKVAPYSGSQTYYPNTVVAISGASYLTLDGIKVYGQTYTWGGHDVTLQNCDFGGGGPSEFQGNVVKLHGGDSGGWNLIVRNNLIHNSCWGENNENGSAIIMYNASALIENNTFYDNWGFDIFTKDSGGQSGRTTEIKHNFFGPSTIYPSVSGIRGHNQDLQVSTILIHHNIFLKKQIGYTAILSPMKHEVFNNTFINCSLDIDSSASGGPYPLITYNNIYHHSVSGQYYMQLYATTYITGSNWNIYSGSGKWGKSAPGALTWQTTLPGWKTFINMDLESISIDPAFVNVSGTTPVDFKRISYAENFTGSSYSTHAGAYETGDELIGHTFVNNFSSIKAPTGLRIK